MCMTRLWWPMLSIVVRFFSPREMLVSDMPPANKVKTAPRVIPAIQLPPSELPCHEVSIHDSEVEQL